MSSNPHRCLSTTRCFCKKCDPTRIISHRGTYCICDTCCADRQKTSPPLTKREAFHSYHIEEKNIKSVKKKAKLEVKKGKQASIKTFFTTGTTLANRKPVKRKAGKRKSNTTAPQALYESDIENEF